MAKLQTVKDSTVAIFYCSGCEEHHQIDTVKWEFNGDFDKPTFKPSYLTWQDPNPNAQPEHDPDGKYRAGFRCHSYITDGFIEYLGDCTHKLAGQKVELPELER